MTENQEVPELNIEDNKIVMPTKKVPLRVNEENKEITIKKLTTGERNKIRQKCVNTTIKAGQPSGDVNSEELQERILSKVIVDAPFDTSQKGIQQLPDNVADYLWRQYTKFGEPSKKKVEE